MRTALRLALGLLGGRQGAAANPARLSFDGEDDSIVVPAAASINDLPAGDFCVEWAGSLNFGYCFSKWREDDLGGWEIYHDGDDIVLTVSLDEGESGATRSAAYELGETVRHFACVYEADPRTIRIYVDGVEQSYAQDSIDTEGEYTTDASADLYIYSAWYESYGAGQVNWLRVSDIARYSSNFTRPSLSEAPAVDGDTVLLYDFTQSDPEGTATDLTDNNNDGTITGATWVSE